MSFPDIVLEAVEIATRNLSNIRQQILLEHPDNSDIKSTHVSKQPETNHAPDASAAKRSSETTSGGTDRITHEKLDDDSLVQAKLLALVHHMKSHGSTGIGLVAQGECKKLCILYVFLTHPRGTFLTPTLLEEKLRNLFALQISLSVLRTMLNKYRAWGKDKKNLVNLRNRGKYEAGKDADTEFKTLYAEQNFPPLVSVPKRLQQRE
jgi:hypothetical protein